jgi:hypothetical protein
MGDRLMLIGLGLYPKGYDEKLSLECGGNTTISPLCCIVYVCVCVYICGVRWCSSSLVCVGVGGCGGGG